MGSEGRLTVRDSSDEYISGVISTAGILYGNVGRLVAALSSDPENIDELNHAFKNYSTLTLEEALSPLYAKVDLHAKLGDLIKHQKPLELMDLDFAIYVDLENKEISFNNTDVPPRNGEVLFYDEKSAKYYDRRSYTVPASWKFNLIKHQI